MSERETPPLSSQEILGLKDEIATRFEQLPPQHQASMALVLAGKVFAGEYGEWMREAITLKHTQQDILEQWRSLPPDAQAAVLIHQLNTMPTLPRAEPLQKELELPGERQLETPKGLNLSIAISTDDLKRISATDEVLAMLDADDLRRIARLMEDHYRLDLFWAELIYHTVNVLAAKQEAEDFWDRRYDPDAPEDW